MNIKIDKSINNYQINLGELSISYFNFESNLLVFLDNMNFSIIQKVLDNDILKNQNLFDNTFHLCKSYLIKNEYKIYNKVLKNIDLAKLENDNSEKLNFYFILLNEMIGLSQKLNVKLAISTDWDEEANVQTMSSILHNVLPNETHNGDIYSLCIESYKNIDFYFFEELLYAIKDLNVSIELYRNNGRFNYYIDLFNTDEVKLKSISSFLIQSLNQKGVPYKNIYTVSPFLGKSFWVHYSDFDTKSIFCNKINDLQKLFRKEWSIDLNYSLFIILLKLFHTEEEINEVFKRYISRILYYKNIHKDNLTDIEHDFIENLKKNTQFQIINIALLKQFFENEIFVSIINEIFTIKNKIFLDIKQKYKNEDKIKYIQAYEFFDFLSALFFMDTTNKRNGLYIVYSQYKELEWMNPHIK